MIFINYHNITYPDMNNGTGLRVVLWLSGCSHKCKGCQNPQTWDFNSGILFDDSAKEELFRELDKDHISGITLSGGDPLAEKNLDGVLDLVTGIKNRYNAQNAYEENPRKKGISEGENDNERPISTVEKSIWIYSGYEWEHIFDDRWHCHPTTSEKLSIGRCRRQQILSKCDVFVDGRYIDSKRDITLKWRGSSNQRVIDVQKSLQQGKVVLWCD